MSTNQTENINNNFFDGYYKEFWRSLIPETLTKAEVEYLVQEAKLQTGSKMLDLMCGYGRHALALARKGIEVTAVDNLSDYVEEIKDISQKENLPVIIYLQDVLKFQPNEKYELTICMGNNLSFFNENETRKLFSIVASCLKEKGKFIFNTWMITEIAAKHFKERSWTYVGETRFLTDSQYLFSPSRIEVESIFIDPSGQAEVKKAVDYIYSLNEIENFLNQSGFRINEMWSIPGKKKFTLGDPRVYIVAEKLA